MKHYSIQQLENMADISKRTIRYYIQLGILDRPLGMRKGASYTTKHLEQLITIKRWKEIGVSLERIANILSHHHAGIIQPKQSGDTQIICRIFIVDGVTLDIDKEVSNLSDSQVRTIGRACLETINDIT